nr:MAG TPA: hypothetical protein [Caudoviricetes sp.]
MTSIILSFIVFSILNSPFFIVSISYHAMRDMSSVSFKKTFINFLKT